MCTMKSRVNEKSRGGWSRLAVVVAGFMLVWLAPAVAAHASVPGPTAANPDSVVTSEDTPVTFDPLDNDSATLLPGTVTVTQPLHGTAAADPATGKITYTPAPHYNGPDSFSYQACDAANVCPSAGVSVDVRLLGPYRMVIGSLNADGTSTFDSMWPDASGERALTTATGTAVAADWAVVSPDGRKLATATGGTMTVSFLDGSQPDQTATVSGLIERPEWSPDSSQLTFGADGEIWTTPVQSLNPQPLTYQVSDGAGGVQTVDVEGYNPIFGSGGKIVFDNFSDLDPADCPGGCSQPGLWWVIPGQGQKPAQLVSPAAAGADEIEEPAWSVNGNLAFLGQVTNAQNQCLLGLYVDDFSSHPPALIKTINTGATGSPCPNSDIGGNRDLSWSPDGTKISYQCCNSPDSDVFVVNRDGSNATQVIFDASGNHPSWDPRSATSPARPWEHGGQLLYTSGGFGSQASEKITRLNPDGSGWTTFLTDGCDATCQGTAQPTEQDAKWSPDGSRIVVATMRGYSTGRPYLKIAVMNADGTGFTSLTDGITTTCEPAWSPDGSKIAYIQQDPSTGYDQLWTMNADGTGKTQLTSTAAYDASPAWSPDGRWIAFSRSADLPCSDSNNPWDPPQGTLMVIPAGGGTAVSLATAGLQPAWSPDGSQLAFASNQLERSPTVQRIYVGSFAADPTPRLTTFAPITPARGDYGAEYGPTWSPDGQAIAYSKHTIDSTGSYLMVINADGTRPTPITSTSGGAHTPDWGVVPGPPTISSFSPASGPAGAAVTITGTNLESTTAVTFNGTTASFHVGSARTVTATVPAGATSGKIALTTSLGTAQSGGDFTVTAAGPTISAINPFSGPVGGDTNVTITGTGFQVGSTVTFGGAAGTVTGGSGSTQLSVTTPAHAAGQADVVVTNPDGQSATVQNGFTYVSGPSISGVSPSSGPAPGGTSVTITGGNFGGPGTTATFGGVPATVTGGSFTTLTVTTPAHAAGAVAVTVTNPDGQSATSANAFTYVAGPAISAVSPLAGPTAGGTSVTITGSNFGGPGTTAAFAGVPATVTGGSSTTLTVTTPAHAAGTVSVTVTNPDGQSAVKANAFTYATLFVTIVPGSGPAGTAVQLAGAGDKAGETVTVKYATGLTRPASVALCSATARPDGTWSCAAKIPATSQGALGPHKITATGKTSKAKATTTFTLTT